MEAIVNVVLPVFANVLAGYACGRLRLLGPGGSEALNGFSKWTAGAPVGPEKTGISNRSAHQVTAANAVATSIF